MSACWQMFITDTLVSACLRIETVNFEVFIGTSWRGHARKFRFQPLWRVRELTVVLGHLAP
jgi:hypothetical protein